ncbi:FAD-dependent oxidoreductase [Ravibacter arvi]|uniref:FAD-dependent oxidoreductase n=1 Tax=Ravibacter arvi TaxID=2051041 RepID=A0ABP8MBM3_9BACT
MHKIFLAAALFATTFLACTPKPSDGNEADIIIYGGTSAAVVAAVQAVKMNKTVIVVSPDVHLGGLTSGGLGFTDSGNTGSIGGLSREFYQRVYQEYQKDENWKWQKKDEFSNKGQGTKAMNESDQTMWTFEPHIAERVYDNWVAELGIPVHRDEWLDRSGGVEVKDGKITAITTLSGKTFRGKAFIDATYEGDLMAAAGVSFHVGREANSVYGEEWNGVQTGVLHHRHWFAANISPYKIPGDSTSGVLPRISTADPGVKNEGDDKIQAYCFRMCLTYDPENRIPFPRPADYDSTQYELLARAYSAGWRETFDKFDTIPNRKTDTNNHGPFSTDNIGMNYDYPNASYERRKEIIREHESYQKGLMYFIANDPRIPKDVQEQFRTWGLPKDEFTDNGNWSHQLYIREARRMVGESVMTEHEVLGKKEVNDPVGMGSYTLDSHNIQRYIKKDGYVQNEGDIGVKVPRPYKISYRSLIPKKEEIQNLLVPICLSSSHIAFGSIRMEPVFMILGQSAATAAAMAVEKGSAVQDIDYAELRARLESDKQRLEVAQK